MKNLQLSQVCRHIPAILESGRWNQEDHKFKASLGCEDSLRSVWLYSKSLSQNTKEREGRGRREGGKEGGRRKKGKGEKEKKPIKHTFNERLNISLFFFF
jgi:hypothetical protein